jgi:hypothetical protein
MMLIGASANLQGRLYRLVDPIRQSCRNIGIYRHHSKRGPAGASSRDGSARNFTSESDLRIFGLDRPEFQKAGRPEIRNFSDYLWDSTLEAFLIAREPSRGDDTSFHIAAQDPD